MTVEEFKRAAEVQQKIAAIDVAIESLGKVSQIGFQGGSISGNAHTELIQGSYVDGWPDDGVGVLIPGAGDKLVALYLELAQKRKNALQVEFDRMQGTDTTAVASVKSTAKK